MSLLKTQNRNKIFPGTKENLNFARYLGESAVRFPDKKAIVYSAAKSKEDIYLTMKELDQLSDRYACGLSEAGISKGTKTMLMAMPKNDFFPLAMALFKIGAVPVFVDPGMGMKRMLHCIRSTGPEAFIGIPMAHVVRLLTPRVFKSLKSWVTIGHRWFWRGSTTLSMKKEIVSEFKMAEAAKNELAAIVFTTGSTGPAKGVEYTHGMLNGMIDQLVDNFNPGFDEVDLATFPMYTLFDVSLGITAVFPDMHPAFPAKADPEKIVKAILDNNVTTMFASPALLKNLTAYCNGKNIVLSSLRRVISGGAPIEPEVMEKVEKIIPEDAGFFSTYGATEAAPISAINSREVLKETRFRTDAGEGTCIGEPFGGVDVKIITVSDDPCEELNEDWFVKPGTTGEVIVRGDIVSQSYFERPDENLVSKIQDGNDTWHRTGDLGWIDEKGRLWYCGRKKQRVTASGKDYFTTPCESLFNTHSAVFRSALVGVDSGSEVIPVICIELCEECKNYDKDILIHELKTIAEGNDIVDGINIILLHDSFPVDIRHNAKIMREKLSLWAGRTIKGDA